jgi:hypothetical protein
MGHEFDVFISYRRVGGDAIAQFLKQNLLRRRLRVFLDVSYLKSGHFGQAILSTIASTPNFVVVLTPGALDLCEDENDWLRREIAQAISAERNIIPILMPGFVYPKVLPKGVAGLSEFQAVSYSHEYADGAAAKLFGMLLRSSAKSWRWLWLTTCLSVFALSAIFGLRIFWKPVRQAPELTTKTAPPSVSSQPRLLAPPISMDPTSASKKESSPSVPNANPVSVQPRAPASSDGTTTSVGFDDIVGADSSVFEGYSNSDISVTPGSGRWLVGRTHGQPAPYIYLLSLPWPSVAESATVVVKARGKGFEFVSVDLYCSMTAIPYVFTGFLNESPVFKKSGTVPINFGRFATVVNPDKNVFIDRLEIGLTQSASPIPNPMGLDNIRVVRQRALLAP